MATTTWHNNIVTNIPSDVDPAQVVAILHDHGGILELNEIVTDHRLQGTEEGGVQVYDVTETIAIIPALWKQKVHFQAKFADKDDGVWTYVNAPMGLKMTALYSVRFREGQGAGNGGGDGSWIIEEEIEASMSVIFKAFVDKTMLASHRNMHRQFIEKARAREASSKPEAGAQAL